MKNIILIIFVMITFIACESKEEKEFIRLVSSSEPFKDEENKISYYFNEDGSLYCYNELYLFDKMYNQKNTNISVAIYKPIETNKDNYAAIMIVMDVIVLDFFSKEEEYTKIDKWIESTYGNEQGEAYCIAKVNRTNYMIEGNSKKETVKNSGKTTDLSKKIKLIDFRICSDRDVEIFL